MEPVVGIIMGSDSDLNIMGEAARQLKEFGVPFEIDICSAHRSPARASEYARTAADTGTEVHHRRRGRGCSPGGSHRRRNRSSGDRCPG